MNEHVPGAKLAERLLTRPDGATMDEIVAAAGGPQYNVLRKLEARGYRIRKVKEGRTTRYFATPPEAPSFEATVTSKGQVTIPQEVRERLRLRSGHKLRFAIENGNRAVITPVSTRLGDLAGILGKPKRTATLEEMDEAIRNAAVERYLRAVGGKKK
jgi:AbrB family looped-hinge helix DNA binding protein